MDNTPDPNEIARIVSQVDQVQAIIASTGDAFGEMYQRLLARKVPRTVAAKIVQDAAHQWYVGTFAKRQR